MTSPLEIYGAGSRPVTAGSRGLLPVKRFFVWSVVSVLSIMPSIVAADEPMVFRCVDDMGRVEFSDVKRKGCRPLVLPKPSPLSLERARAGIEEFLTDPESTRYRSLVQVKRTGAVCGRVNSKNRMGGYDGYKYVYVREVGDRMEVRFEGEPGFNRAYLDICSERSRATSAGGQ